jgi:hypothetical protein
MNPYLNYLIVQLTFIVAQQRVADRQRAAERARLARHASTRRGASRDAAPIVRDRQRVAREVLAVVS